MGIFEPRLADLRVSLSWARGHGNCLWNAFFGFSRQHWVQKKMMWQGRKLFCRALEVPTRSLQSSPDPNPSCLWHEETQWRCGMKPNCFPSFSWIPPTPKSLGWLPPSQLPSPGLWIPCPENLGAEHGEAGLVGGRPAPHCCGGAEDARLGGRRTCLIGVHFFKGRPSEC